LQSDVANTRHIIQQAKGEEPLQALAVLQQAQQQLSKDLDSGQLSPQSAKDARTALNSDLPAAVQDALQRYNKNAHITPLTSDHANPFGGVCPPLWGQTSPPGPLADVPALTATAAPQAGAPTQALYALSGGALYRLNVPLNASGAAGGGAPTCTPIA